MAKKRGTRRRRDTADPGQVRSLESMVRLHRENMLACLVAVMQTAEGRFVLGEWLEQSRLFRSSWVPAEDPSALTLAFNEGMRNAGLRMMADLLDADAALYAQVDRERQIRRRSEQAHQAATETRGGESTGDNPELEEE